MAQKAKLVFQVNTGAALLGMGYIVGLKYAAIICAGSILTWWIIVPGIALIWPDMNVSLDASKTILASAARSLKKYTIHAKESWYRSYSHGRCYRHS